MTMREFISNLFLNCQETLTAITVEDAAYDLENFRTDGLDLPEGITPETYAEAWNEAVAEDRDDYTYGE